MLLQSDPLPTTFQCLFCNHENAVSVKMEKKIGIATLSCKVCSQSFQAKINRMYFLFLLLENVSRRGKP